MESCTSTKIKNLIGVIFLVVTLLYSFTASVGLQFGLGYTFLFYGAKILPITLMGLYLIYKPKWLSSTLKYSSYVLVVTVILALPFFVSTYLSNPINYNVSGYTWYYPAVIEWSLCFVLSWFLCNLKTKNTFFSFVFAFQIIVFGGTLYELPVNNLLSHSDLFYSFFYPFFIATIWLSLIFIIYFLFERQWHLTKLFFFLLVIYIAYSIFYYFNPYFNGWLPRLPTISLLSTLPLGFRSKSVLSSNLISNRVIENV